tara:strand:+ start:3042 stop:3467 length:426 start_codon:yes stop_codon:yes gene_type:complete
MSNQSVNFSRQVFNKQKFQNTVDTQFTQLVQIPDETFFDPSLATVEDFFIIYDNLFFDIPQLGEANSHEFLIKQSTEYIGFKEQNETIQALLDEITELRQENLEIRQQNLNLVEQFSRGVTSTEAEIITTGANIAGINNGG